MGSHEPAAEDALHRGGRPEPADAPIGRRLRPEQSATGDVLPAPEDRVDSGPAEADRTGGRWRLGAPVKVAALTVAAAAAMLGGTAAGVQAWKDSAGPLFGCSTGECPTAGPEGDAAEPGEPDPGEEPPRPERSSTAAPSPSPSPEETTGRPGASRTPKARPAAQEPTRRPRGTGSASGGDEEARKQDLSAGRPGTPREETPTRTAAPTPTQTAAPTPTQAPSTAPPPDSGNGDRPGIPLPLPLPLPLDGKG
ncbi:hypothetical protein Ppa06_08250 [Planomonospora parontospora subsp. parontospora]|uniref:Uncharacterized protein n=2 Tax=Planomonospora parontospora TaxID=58119 RepID=A0AA37BD78_9ACTN|nr:hypothetical protein [Planomonospora parontospora]GGK51203.1 hypothetical protein GCM10010126_08360 [Planomonospora parontospora]GII07027.1 hypothetical protein Ppa06_08250 [Planomonospora parontospora subsp. parontospora]